MNMNRLINLVLRLFVVGALRQATRRGRGMTPVRKGRGAPPEQREAARRTIQAARMARRMGR